jgi:N-acetylmuramoyl-L-alanine amidase
MRQSISRKKKSALTALVVLVALLVSVLPGYAALASGGSDSPGAGSLADSWYFAEGTTRSGFTTYIAVMNPNSSDATCTFDYMLADGTVTTKKHQVKAQSRFTIDVSSDVGADKDVSTHLTSSIPVVAERPMYFSYHGWGGGHDSLGATSLAKAWYFSEGTTRTDFVTYLAILNPDNADATCTVSYMLGDGSTVIKPHLVKAHSRATIDVSADVGPGKDASSQVDSTVPVVVERPMYFDYQGKWTGGSDSLGALAPSGGWYFAEGTTRSDFVTYLAVSNPGTADADCTFDYMLADGTTVTKKHQVKAHSRYTVDASSDVGAGNDVSTHLSSAVPVVAERPMYFDFRGSWDGGHDAMGAAAPTGNSYFAEGTTRAGFVTYLAVLNPGNADAACTFDYMLADGTTVTKTHQVQAHSRFTVDVSGDVGGGKDVSTHVSSAVPVVTERPMYFSGGQAYTICVDPGHSGHDGNEIDQATGLNVGDNMGAPGELQNNWDVGLKLKARLEADGYNVKLTKSAAGDYVDLRKRADIANACTVWIRLHYDDGGYTGIMRPPPNAARCPASDMSRITVVLPSVASSSDSLGKAISPFLGLDVTNDTGGTTNGNATPPGHPTCLIGSCLSQVPVVSIENKMWLVRDNPAGQDQVAGQIAAGVESYLQK